VDSIPLCDKFFISIDTCLFRHRVAKEIRSSLEAKITLKCTGEMYDFLKSVESELTAAYIVSEIEIVNDESARGFYPTL